MEKYKLNPITQDMDIVGEGAGDVINNYGVYWNDETPLPPQKLAWGDITGDIEDQTDLAEALNGKADKTEIPSLAPYRTSAAQDIIDAAKLQKPSDDGLAGQVLTTDGDGGVSWEPPQGGGYTPMPRVTTIPADGNYNPNTLYVLDFGTTARTINLVSAATGYAAEYHIIFATGATAPTITWPTGLTWADAPAIKANMTYELNVLEGKAVVKEWGAA